jgi:P4 family phage/plasmid primase-like protien
MPSERGCVPGPAGKDISDVNDLSNEAVEIKDPHRQTRDLSKVLFPDTTKLSPSIETAPLPRPKTFTNPTMATNFIKAVFGNSATEQPIRFSSFDNDRSGDNPSRHLTTRDTGELTGFMTKYDRHGRALFFSVGTLKDATKERSKENIAEISMLHADIDLKDVEDKRDDVERKLRHLTNADGRPFPPSIMVFSGHGVHAYWLLTESLDPHVDANMADIEQDLRTLADLVGGDSKVCEVARLMRLPGSHNTKLGEWSQATVVHPAHFDGETVLHRYELEDLREMLREKSPIILRKARVVGKTVGEGGEDCEYTKYWKEDGHKPPIDVENRINAMMYMGGEKASIHDTQIAVAASMVGKGHNDDEIVELLGAATRAAAGAYGQNWNWTRELRDIRRDVVKWRKEHPPKPGKNPSPIKLESVSVSTSTDVAVSTVRTVNPDNATHIKVGDNMIRVIKDRGDAMIFMDKTSWYYADGLWTMDATDRPGWLKVGIEKSIMAGGYSSSRKLRDEVLAWIQIRPEFWRKEVKWDQHGMVPTRSGLVDPRTLELIKMQPEHYATWRIECEYEKEAKCPHWLRMLEDVFEDRKPDVRAATIAVIQELLGAGLIDRKPRGLSKALIFHGGSNFGKSGLLEVLGGLFGQEVNGTGLKTLEGPHGMMGFIRRMPWVLHEAFDQREWHFSSSVKAIVTGEPIQINIKNGPLITRRIDAPIFWGTNHPPQFKESTKAIVNRIVVIDCRREFIEGEAVGAAIAAIKKKYEKPSALVLAEEMPGLLTWALQGLQRALERGFIEQTPEMKSAGEEVRAESNLVARFLEECVAYDVDHRVSSPDFCLAFAAWWAQEKGEDRQVPSNDVIGKALLAMSDNKIAIDRKELKDMHRRYYCGIVLNYSGLSFHKAGFTNNDLLGKTASASVPGEHVNERIPESWLQKPSIVAMQQKQKPA